jgi:protein-disulfide isomerase
MSRTLAPTTRRERRAAERATRPHRSRPARTTHRRFSLENLSLLGLFGGIVAVALAIAFGSQPPAAPAHDADVAVAYAPAGIPAVGFAIGSPDAPVTIDLYEDFQCPACEAWGRTVFPMLAANELAAGTVRVVFHDIAFLGQESVDAGMAAYAAAQQGRFWDMWATLYANQGHEHAGAFSRERLMAMAGALGFDVARFEADMDSSGARSTLAGSKNAASQAGITSTPTIVIGGQAQVGVGQYEALAAAIAAAAAATP